MNYKDKGDLIFLLGKAIEDIGSSEYLYSYHGVKGSPAPYFDLEEEYTMQETLKGLITSKLINAAHDCADGGLFVTLFEMGLHNELGFDIITDSEIREDAFLFGEAQGRVVVTLNEDTEEEFIDHMMENSTSFTLLGHVTRGKVVVDDDHHGFIEELRSGYDNKLKELMD
jgi:phosphoribosylformylglycinamidine synthase